MSWPDPSTLGRLVQHLFQYGECYVSEVERSAQPWLALLTEVGWLQPLSETALGVSRCWSVLWEDNADNDRLRRICFAVPQYRSHLLAILAQGLVEAGQISETEAGEQYAAKIQDWVTGTLVWLAPEINQLMDQAENGGKRLVDRPAAEVRTAFDRWHMPANGFASWDKALLGLNGSPDELFSSVITRVRFIPTAIPGPDKDMRRPALLPELEITYSDEGRLVLPPPAPWSAARLWAGSTLPFYTETGNAFYDPAMPVQTVWQDALAQQPYYRALLRVAIIARRSLYDAAVVQVFAEEGSVDCRVHVPGCAERSLSRLLPELVESMGYQAITHPTAARTRQMVRDWIALGAMEIRQGELRLQEGYNCSLHERRRRQALLLESQAQAEQAGVSACLKGG